MWNNQGLKLIAVLCVCLPWPYMCVSLSRKYIFISPDKVWGALCSKYWKIHQLAARANSLPVVFILHSQFFCLETLMSKHLTKKEILLATYFSTPCTAPFPVSKFQRTISASQYASVCLNIEFTWYKRSAHNSLSQWREKNKFRRLCWTTLILEKMDGLSVKIARDRSIFLGKYSLLFLLTSSS